MDSSEAYKKSAGQSDIFYPVKLTSHTVAKKRGKRVFWLAASTAFGIGCVSAFAPQIVSSLWVTAELKPIAAEPTVQLAQSFNDVAPAPVAAAEPTPAAPVYPQALNLTVANGDTLIHMLTDAGVSYEEANNAVESMREVYDPGKLGVGKNVAVTLEKAADTDKPVIASLTLPTSATSSVEITRTADADFDVKKVDAPVERKLAHAGGNIDSSLYQTGIDAGIPASLLQEIIKAYSYDVDFQRDIKPGDALDVLFEKMETKDGVVAGHGNMVFAELVLGNRRMKIYRYADKHGNADYYNEKGESVRKALLRTPINGAHITSSFGMRMHPLLGYSKMHRGVDFGAATGTPIYAAGDGTIAFEGTKGGYGNYLLLKHNNKYASAYAHISRFAKGVAPGSRVKQGQVIAYVGATGMATGPHLHYEILVNNEQVNPANIKFKTGNVLGGKELVAFKSTKNKIEAKLAAVARGKTDVAMNDIQVGNSKN